MDAIIMDYFKTKNDWLTPQQVAYKTENTIEHTKNTIDIAVKQGFLLWSIFEGTYMWNQNH